MVSGFSHSKWGELWEGNRAPDLPKCQRWGHGAGGWGGHQALGSMLEGPGSQVAAFVLGWLLSQSFQFQVLLFLVCVLFFLPFTVLSLWVIGDLQAANYEVYIPMK